MSQPLIEKNIPIPMKYPFAQMNVNDSFAVPASVSRSTVNVAAMRFGRKFGMKFTVRLTTDGTLRCWRIA